MWANATGCKPVRLRFRSSFLAFVHGYGGTFNPPEENVIVIDSLDSQSMKVGRKAGMSTLEASKMAFAVFGDKLGRTKAINEAFKLIYGTPREHPLHLIENPHGT